MPVLLFAMFCLEGDDTHTTITLCIVKLQDADNDDQAATDLLHSCPARVVTCDN